MPEGILGPMQRPSRTTMALSIVLAVAVVAAFFVATNRPRSPSSTVDNPSPCPRSTGLCTERNVTRVLDGDTLDVEGGLRIRLVLVDAPALSESGGLEAGAYLEDLCLGARALIDEDDFQIGADPYGRTLAVVYCHGTNANAAMISSGRADTYYQFCPVSEFGDATWSGCDSAPPPTDCDPSYPDVCIPSPPPDLDCADITYRDFQVLPPDPHRFDGDGDGIGCET
jgi:micrococcal nuclease